MNRRALSLFCVLATVPSFAAAMETHEPNILFLQADRFEYRAQDGGNSLEWDAHGWLGGDYQKLWLKTEGEKRTHGKVENAEAQLLYSRLITDFFDVQAGVRYDVQPHPRHGYAVLGIEGMAPYYIETDAALFLSNKGDLSARFKAEYDLLLTQRLILQPAFEINMAVQEVAELGIGAGVNEIELGLRLRHEIRREFAPYIGLNWQRKLGQTADFAQADGEDAETPSLIAGIRFWF